MFYTTNSSPMLITKSVFKVTFILSNYQLLSNFFHFPLNSHVIWVSNVPLHSSLWHYLPSFSSDLHLFYKCPHYYYYYFYFFNNLLFSKYSKLFMFFFCRVPENAKKVRFKQQPRGRVKLQKQFMKRNQRHHSVTILVWFPL